MPNRTPVVGIPVIDISGDLPESQVAQEIVDAAIKYGFVYVKNLGKDIPVDLIDRTFDLVRILLRAWICCTDKFTVKEVLCLPD